MSIAAAAGANTDSTNIVYIPQVNDHTGTAGNDRPNVSQNLNLNIVVEDEDLVAAVNGSVLTFALYADTDATTVTTDGDVIITRDITANTTSAQPDGTQLFSIPLPVETFNPYLQLNVAVATQNLSTGKITAWIGNAIQQGQ
jgi:hypothetical protein